MPIRSKTLADLGRLLALDGRSTAEVGQWYLIESSTLLRGEGGLNAPRFAAKEGSRPCIVVREWDGSAGDVCRVLPRSASGTSGIQHPPHAGRCSPRPHCHLTRHGRIVDTVPCFVTGEGMRQARSSCDEPDEVLMQVLAEA